MSVHGAAAIDDCIGGVCPTYCGGPTCDVNSNYVAYPNYPACTGHDCTVQSDKPRASGCNANVWFSTTCTGGVEYAGSIFECGPCPGQSTSDGACNTIGETVAIVACITTHLFTRLCGTCNPTQLGVIKIDMHL